MPPVASDGSAAEALPKRWSAARKAEIAIRLLTGEGLDALSREIQQPASRICEWRDRSLGSQVGLEGRLHPSAGGLPTARRVAGAQPLRSDGQLHAPLLRASRAGSSFPLLCPDNWGRYTSVLPPCLLLP